MPFISDQKALVSVIRREPVTIVLYSFLMLHISPSCILSLQSTTSGSDEGGSLDFMAPGAVSQLMYTVGEFKYQHWYEHLE